MYLGPLVLSWSLAILLAATASAQAVAASPSWALTLRVLESWDSNVRFATPGGGGDLGSQLDAGVSRAWQFHRGKLRATGDATETVYRNSRDLNHLTYDLGIITSYRLSHRATLNVDDRLLSSYARDVATLTATGLLFPAVLIRTNTAGGTFAYALSPRTQIRWELRDDRVSFDSSQFRGASSLTSRTTMMRQLSRSHALEIIQEYQHTASGTENGTIQALVGAWEGTFANGLALTAAAGVRAYRLLGRSAIHLTPSGSLGLKGQFRRRDTLGVQYARTVDQAIGFAQLRMSDVVSLNYSLSFGTKLGLDSAANYGRSVDPVEQSFRFVGRTGSAEIRYVLIGNLAAAGGYSFWQRSVAPTPIISSHRSTLSLVHARTWR